MPRLHACLPALVPALLLGLLSCGADEDDSAADAAGVPDAFSACTAADGDPTWLETASITDDTLSLDVSYGGGCETHTFQICWDGSFAESAPVQVWLELWHDAAGDGCEAELSETLTFDLTPLKASWQAAYGAESGEITVHTGGGTVAYSF